MPSQNFGFGTFGHLRQANAVCLLNAESTPCPVGSARQPCCALLKQHLARQKGRKVSLTESQRAVSPEAITKASLRALSKTSSEPIWKTCWEEVVQTSCGVSWQSGRLLRGQPSEPLEKDLWDGSRDNDVPDPNHNVGKKASKSRKN
jgi:hypothetical protein